MLVASILISTVNVQLHFPLLLNTDVREVAWMMVDDYLNRHYPSAKQYAHVIITDEQGIPIEDV